MFFIQKCIDGLIVIWNQQMRGFSNEVFIITSAICIVLSFLILYIVSCIQGTKFNIARFLILCLLAIYVCFMFQIAIYRRELGSEHRIRTDIDLGSFSGDFVAAYQVGYCALNMLFFMPFGFLIAVLRAIEERKESYIKQIVMTTLCGFLCSSIIEITQLVTGTGIFEMTDIFINTLGGMSGALVASSCRFWYLRRLE